MRTVRIPTTVKLAGFVVTALAVSMLLVRPASAATAQSNWTNYSRGTNCTVYVYLDKVGTTFTAGAQVPCASRYASTGLYVELQWWTSATVYPKVAQRTSTVFTNSYGTGSRTLWTASSTPGGHGCISYRAVAHARINSDPGEVLVQTNWQQVCI